MNKMLINFIDGINGGRIEVEIIDESSREIFKEEYTYGFNASYNRKLAEYAKKDYEVSIKYNLKNKRILKPFIGDIINDICKKYNISKSGIRFSGKHIFNDTVFTNEELQEWIGIVIDLK